MSALLLLVSCWTPVFNQDLSVAELVRGKLRLDNDFKVTLNNGNNDGNQLQAGVSYDGTAWVVLNSNRSQVSAQGMFGTSSYTSQTSLDVPLTDPSQVMIQPDTSEVNWYIPTLPHTSGGAGDVRNIAATGNTGQYSANWSGASNLIGFCTTENNAGTVAVYYLVQTTASTATLYQTPTVSLWSGSLTYSGTAGWMAVDPSGSASGATGYVVYLTHAPDTNGKYVTDVIAPNAGASGLLATWQGRDHVAGFLSTGRLLTREGSFYNVCDANGKILYSFPAGTLQFAGEYYDTTTMRVRFTEALLETPQNGGQDKVRVRVYSIESAKLDSLQ